MHLSSIVTPIFSDFRLDEHLPGLVFGLVSAGHPAVLGAVGVSDLDRDVPVGPATMFRIASMTKAFTALTILQLRDQGLVELDAPAERYVPELRRWRMPVGDARAMRVRDLLHHTAGLVTDDPWGDRQNPLPEADFSALLAQGVPFTRPPGEAYEYSNLGYALLGRIIVNLGGEPYAAAVRRRLLLPLGMGRSGFDPSAYAPDGLAQGYRWEDHAWRPEPTLGDGAFSAMGGLLASAEEYLAWLRFLLEAWPPRDGSDAGPVCRATVREMAQGANFPRLRRRPAREADEQCLLSATYAMGLDVALDPELGLTLSHSGGYPGYGSHMLLLPARGAGIFAFANRTYAGPAPAVWDAARALVRAGALPEPAPDPASDWIVEAHRQALAMYGAGRVDLAPGALGMNFLLDRDAPGWAADLAQLRAEVGAVVRPAALVGDGQLAGSFVWECTHGRLQGWLTLTPTRPPALQSLRLSVLRVAR